MNELFQALVYDDSSDGSSSDDEDTALLLHVAFPPSEAVHRARVCIEDLSEYECERLFR